MAQKAVEGRSAGRRSRPSDSVAQQTDTLPIAQSTSPANALTVVMSRDGMVIAVLTGPAAARAFLREVTR